MQTVPVGSSLLFLSQRANITMTNNDVPINWSKNPPKAVNPWSLGYVEKMPAVSIKGFVLIKSKYVTHIMNAAKNAPIFCAIT